MKSARDVLIELYLDYFHNFLTDSGFAEEHGLELIEARQLIDLARTVAHRPRPEA
jgi:hypothetical protein